MIFIVRNRCRDIFGNIFIGYGPHNREDCLNIGENLSQAGSNGVKKLTEILYAESIQHHAMLQAAVLEENVFTYYAGSSIWFPTLV